MDSSQLASITSVIASAASRFDEVTSILATATDKVTTLSLINDAENLQATLSYYSILNVMATATDSAVESKASTAAIAASSYVHQLFDDNAYYNGNAPSFGGNIALIVVMGLFLAFHLVVGVFTRQWWFFVCYLIGLILEVIGYIGRVISSHNVQSFNGFVIQFVCITLGPCFFLAGIYYLLAELTVIYGEKNSLFKPMHYSIIFISCDLIAIILQAVGGGLSAVALSEFESTDQGSNIMVGGLSFQVAAMIFFQYCWYRFLYKVYKQQKIDGDESFPLAYAHIRKRKMFKYFPAAISGGILFIFIRSIYRIAELSHGFGGKLANEETTFMILETLMICIALVFMTSFHPGLVYGKNPDIVTRGKRRLEIHAEEQKARGFVPNDDEYAEASNNDSSNGDIEMNEENNDLEELKPRLTDN